MLSSINLKEILENHPIFEKIWSDREDDEPGNEQPSQLIHITSSNFFIWEDKRSCLLTSNLRETLTNDDEKIQMLLCRNPPTFEVRSVAFSPKETHVALIGARGVIVVVLPKRWGRDAEYEGGKEKIVCRSFPVAERFFISNISVQLLQASWFPDAPSPHICLLTSDNMLRIYNVSSDSELPVQIHRLILEANMSITGSHMSLLSLYSVTSSLGETVISFDFSSTIDYIPNQNLLNKKTSRAIRLQPIYLLQGNGDVLLLLTSLSDNKFSKGVLHGPLIMLPPAEDNYGTDSCSIHVMKTHPSVVVIATTSGELHHCLSLWAQGPPEEHEPLDGLDTQSVLSKSLSLAEMSIKGEIHPPTLYVYETVELDLSLQEDEMESHHITLHADTILSSRYHCCTSVGVHSVALPWLHKIDGFIKADDENDEILTEITSDDHCAVEHVLCTKSTASTRSCDIKGLTIATDPMLGPSLICFTADNHCTVLKLLFKRAIFRNTFRPSSPPLLSAVDNDETLVNSPLKKLQETNFEEYVRSLLRRTISQPIIRSGAFSGENSDKECFQLVTKATQILRDEYMLKQKLARDAIVKRVELLNVQKDEQKNDLEELDIARERLTTTAEEIATSYEDCQDRQESLLRRLDVVAKRVKINDPVLSKAEVDMGKELKALSEKLHLIDNGIKQLKVKQEYQKKKSVKQEQSGDYFTKINQVTGNTLQIDQFKQILLEEGEKISELIKKLNNMNVQVGL